MAKPSCSCFYFQLFCCFAVLCLLPTPCLTADPDALQDFCVADLKAEPRLNGFPCKDASKVTSDDFFFDGFDKGGNTSNPNGSKVIAGNVHAFPGLNTLGISMNQVDLAPGGLNPPHSHPRATEAGVVIKGEVLVGFVTTGNVFYSKVLSKGEMFVVPRGLVHFQLNVGKREARLFTAFNSHLPGLVTAATTLFSSTPSVPIEVLTKAFQVDDKVIDNIKCKMAQKC